MHIPQVPVKVVKREIAFSTGVTHDNIVKLLDVFAEKTQLVIVVSENTHIYTHTHCSNVRLPGQDLGTKRVHWYGGVMSVLWAVFKSCCVWFVLTLQWELISGPDLLDLLNEHHGTMPEGLAAFYFCQLLKAVS